MFETPHHNTTRFLDDFRTAQISHLLTAAVCEFDVGRVLSKGPLSFDEICGSLQIVERPAIVLLTALRSIDLIDVNLENHIDLTEYGREKLTPDSPFHLRGYIGLGAFSADVQNMIACLKNDRPVGDVSFVFHDHQQDSALDDPHVADVLTRAMADRARNIAPILASELDLSSRQHLVDVGGGHGLYSFYLMRKHPELRTTIIDRGPALSVAKELALEMALSDRTTFLHADIHNCDLPASADCVLMANILHDYNASDAGNLVRRFADGLPTGGQLMVLDSLLDSVPSEAPPVSQGPREVAAYSGLLFSICEGRCYRLDELDSWMTQSGLNVDQNIGKLPAHGSLVNARKR